ncbi:MAG: glycosyltransferase family 1 protein [Bdellovibrionota bacterium]
MRSKHSKKIAIDARMVTSVPHGFSRYVTAIAQGLAQVSKHLDYEPVFLVCKNCPREALNPFEKYTVRAPFLHPSELIELPRVLSKLKVDIYHSPTFSSLLIAPCPWIVTVHDLNHLQFGGIWQKIYYKVLLKHFVFHARAVMSVSEFSKQELAKWMGFLKKDIEVVPNAINPELFEAPSKSEQNLVLQKYGLESNRYFFCLSNPKPHKNVGMLVEAFSDYRHEMGVPAAWPLVLSMGGFSDVNGVKALGGLNDFEGRVLMHSCGALVFPSLYEGFGLPPVEAVAIGIPVITSKIPPHEEVLRDCGSDGLVLADPTDKEQWVSAMLLASGGGIPGASSGTRQKIRGKYTIEKLGQNMDRIYRRVLKL